MPLRITDETAGVLILTIDNSGLICFGNGTPVSALSVNGTAVVDSAGLITNQRVNGSSLVPTSGTVNCAPGFFTTVTTLSGRRPTVQLDTVWPAVRATHVPFSSGPPAIPEHCTSTNLWASTVHKISGVADGSFTVRNNDQPDDSGLCGTGHSDDTTYRWI